MGLLNKVKLRFITEELNTDKIKQLFYTCLESENTTHPYPIYLTDSFKQPNIVFDADVFNKHRYSIYYILGQLNAVHKKQINIDFSELGIRYDGTKLFDEDDKVTPIQLLALGIAAVKISSLRRNNSLDILSTKKSLSPYDPEYKTWWAEHQQEWIPPEAPNKQ